MLKLYFYDCNSGLEVSIHEPVWSSCEQALEIFDSISKNSNSRMGVVSNQGFTTQISKYNKFVWLIEIPHPKKKGNYQIFLTPTKVKSLIFDLYEGFNPMNINGLMFDKNK